uniref:Transcription activation suppressor family member 2 n=1 Tax=Paramormyrops kingsleyae TaxID=1676925 RepID=A0A3B3R064_9TELE
MENGSNAADTGLLEPVPLDSEIFKGKILPVLQDGHMYSESERSFRYTSVLLVNSPALQEQYSKFRAEREESGYTHEELEESFGFLLLDDENKVNNLCETGLAVGHSACFTLGDPSKGVYISKYSDCLDLNPWYQRKTGYVVVFKLTKGRVRAVAENYTQNYTQPTPGFDCHMSEQISTVSPATCSFLAYERTQYYLYELRPGGPQTRRPRHACPFAAVAFTYGEAVPTTSVLQEQSFGLNKTAVHYHPWSGQLQVGSLVFPVALRSSASAVLPSQLPATLNIEHLIRLSDLKKLLPQAIFETCFCSEVCFEGWYCSLHVVFSMTAEEQLSQLAQELKDKDLALILRLNDSGFLVFLHSSFLLTYEDSMSRPEDVLQGLFVFQNSRVVQKDMKNWRSKLLLPSEILKALPGLTYAEAEVEKCPSNQQAAPCYLVEKHLQNYAALIQPGMRDSPSQEASIFPDQYDVPDVSKHLRSAPGTTEASRLRLLSYLNQPEDYSLPITRVMELLEVGKDDEVIDLDNDTYYCISSPDDAPVTATGSCNNVNLEEGLREKKLREEPQTLVGKETEGMFDVPLQPLPSEDHGRLSMLELASLDGSVQTSGTLASSSLQELPLAEAGDTTKRVAPLLIVRQIGKRKSRRRKRRKGNLTIVSQEAPVGESFLEKTESATIQPNTLKRKTYQYGLRTIITDCGRVFIPHGSQDITSSTVSMTDTERVTDAISKETGARTDSPLVPNERADGELSPREWVDNQAVLIEAAEQHVSPLVNGQAPATEGASRLAPSLRKVDGRLTLRKTKLRGQIVSEETRDKEVQPSEIVDRGLTIDMEAPSMAVTVEKGDTEAVSTEVASGQTLCIAREDGQLLQPNVDSVTPFTFQSIENRGVPTNVPPHTNITDKKQPELSISTAHQKGKRKNPLCLISPLLTVLGDANESAILSNEGPRPKRGKSCLSENEAENLNINCGNTVAPTLANILSDSSLRKALGSDPELGVQVERAEGNPKVRTWLRRGIPRKSDIADSDGTQCIQKSPIPVTMTEIEKLVKPLKKQLRNRITKYMKENGWFNFDTTASYGSDKLTQPQAQGHNSAASGDRGGGGVSGTLFVGSHSPEVGASQSPDALTLLADLALSASDDKLLQGLSPVLGAKLAPGGQNCGTGTDDDTVAGSVLHSLLGHPLPKRRPRRTKRHFPIKSPSPKGVIVTGELVLVISKEHSYSLPPSCLLLGVSGVFSQVPPPVPSGQTDSHCGNSPIVVEKGGTSPCQEVRSAQEMQRLPAESSNCNSKGRRKTCRCWRRVVEVDGLLRITRLWKEKYEFCLDSKYTNNPLDKAVTRALHGPWDSSIEENIEQVHLILHMWIGLFYSKSTTRFFQTDSDGEILSPNRNLHAAKTALESGYSRFTQDFHTTEPEPLDLREERKISEEPLSPTTEILDLSQNQLDVLDLSVPKYGREEMSHVASEMESSTSLHKPDKPIDLAITDTASRSMVVSFLNKERRGSVDSILDEEPEEESGNHSDFQNDCGFELQHLSEPPQNDFVYDELCRHTGHMYISGGKVLNMTCEGKQARAFATVVASQLSGKLGGHVDGLGKKRTTYLQPCKFTSISFVPDVIKPQLVVTDSNLLEGTTKKDSIYNCNVSMPVAVHDGKDHTVQQSVVRPDGIDLEGGKDTEILESVQVEVYSDLLDQSRREAEVPPCDGHNSDVVVDFVESNTSNQSIVPDKWSDVDDVRNSGQDFSDAVASQKSKSPAPTLDELPCEPKPCFHSKAHSNKLWSSHDETHTSNECTSTGDLGGIEIPNSSPSSQQAVTDILTCVFDASVQNADNKPSPDSTSEPIVSSIDMDMENALLSCNDSGVLCSKSPTQVSQEGRSVSPLHSPSRLHPSSSYRTNDQSMPTSTSQENACLNSSCNLDENPQYKDGTSDSVNDFTVTPDSLHSSSGSAVKRSYNLLKSSQPGHTSDSLMPNLSTSNPHCSESSNAANSPESYKSSLKDRPSTPELYLQPCSSPGRSLNSSAMLQSPSNNTKVSTTNLTQCNYSVCSDNKHNQTEESEVSFEKDVTCAIDQSSDQSRNSIDDLLGKVQDESHSGAKDPSKYNVAYDNPEPYDDSINMPIDHSQSRLHSDHISLETPPQEDFASCPSRTSENSDSSPEENIKNYEPHAIRSSSYKEIPNPVNYDSDLCSSLLHQDLHSSIAVKSSKNQEYSLEDIPALSRVSEHTVSMDNKKDPNDKSATAEEMRNVYEQQNEEVEDEEYNLLEKESLNRFPAEERGSEDISQSAHCISDPYFSMKTSKHKTDCKMKKRFSSVYQKVITDEQTDREFLDNRQKNSGLIFYKTRISERISDSPITRYTANYKPETDWTNYCKRIETLKRNKHPVKEDHGMPSHSASPIITVFDHKGNRMTYENYPIVKPGPSGRVRMIRNSGSYLHNFQQKWEELHLARPDMTQDTMDLEYLIFSEKMNQIIKNNQKTSRSTRYSWRRQAMSDVDVTSKNSAVGIHVSKELQNTRLPLRRWKMKGDRTNKAWSRKRKAVSSMPCEPPLSLRRLSHLDCKGDSHPAVSDITVECASSYHTILNDICSGRKFLQHTSKPKEDSALPPCDTREHIFEQMQEETFKDMQEKINVAVRLSSKTKFKFYILVTSDDYFFEQTKELLVAEGHDCIEPEDFDLEGQKPTSPLLIIIRNEDIAEHIYTIPQLLELKRSARVLFAGIDRPDDVLHLTHQELFGNGGFVVCNTDVLCSLTLDNMKRLVQALEGLSRKGKWLWFLHYRDSRLLKENARLSTEARDRKQFLESCQEAGLVETVPYHDCDIMSRDQPDYLQCMIRLQAQHITARFAIFITDVPDDNFENYGIFAMDIDTFLRISRRISTLAEFCE